MRLSRAPLFVLGLTLALGSLTRSVPAQICTPGFEGGFHTRGADANVRKLISFDDGSGPALYAAGDFVTIGGTIARHIARWDGTSWHPLTNGAGFDGSVFALCVFDDGSGPHLFAGGTFITVDGVVVNKIAKFDGTAWVAMGTGMTLEPGFSGTLEVDSLCAFDDGHGSALYAGGFFTVADGNPVHHIVRWTGSTWADVGGGTDGYVRALVAADLGTGPKLYAGGSFYHAGGIPARAMAVWDGTSWSAAGTQDLAAVYDFVEWDDGIVGDALYVAGTFASIGGVSTHGVARYDGTQWSALGSGLGFTTYSGWGYSLALHDDGSGTSLYVGGVFDSAGGITAANVARWNGQAWSAVGDGLIYQPTISLGSGAVQALTSFGSKLYAGGAFAHSGTTTMTDVASFDGVTWSPMSDGQGTDGTIDAFQVFDDGAGPALYAGGIFRAAGVTVSSNVARWNGVDWSPLDAGTNGEVLALAQHNDGSGPALYAGGTFTQAGGIPTGAIARWNGSAWSALGSAPQSTVRCIAVFDDGAGGGPQLYAGGDFILPTPGGTNANRIARWDGSSWHAVGSGPGASDKVRALAVFDDGSGPGLYAGGAFFGMDGVLGTARIAKWNGTTWLPVGAGLDKDVYDFAIFDAGSGPRLYIGGSFNLTGSAYITNVARLENGAWTPLMDANVNGVDARINALEVYDDGSGSKLYAAGVFSTAGATPSNGFARWDGSHWTNLDPGVEIIFSEDYRIPRTLQAFDDGGPNGPDLFMGGSFAIAGGAPAQGLAVWRGCKETGTAFCLGDGSATACPCGNTSAIGAGEGCAHSLGTGGRLDTTGWASVAHDSLILRGSHMPNSAVVYIQGTQQQSGGLGTVFGDGLRCVAGSVIRLSTKINATGGSHFPGPSDVSVSVRGFVPAGATRHYQAWFRNAAAFCTPSTFNLSNGVSVLWSP